MDFIIPYGIDLFLIVLLILTVIHSARNGFVRTVLTLLAVILAFGISLKAAEPLASWGYDTFLNRTVCEKIEENAPDLSAAKTAKEVVDGVAAAIPEQLGELLKKIDVDLDDVSRQLDAAQSKDEPTSQQLSDAVVKPAAMVVLKTLCTLLCFIILMAVFRCVIRLICKVTKLPVLRTANKALGGALGLVKGLMLIYLLAMLFSLIGQVTEKPEIKQAVDRSVIIATCQSIGETADRAEAGTT